MGAATVVVVHLLLHLRILHSPRVSTCLRIKSSYCVFVYGTRLAKAAVVAAAVAANINDNPAVTMALLLLHDYCIALS